MSQKQKVLLLRQQVEAILRTAALIAVASLLAISASETLQYSSEIGLRYASIPVLIGAAGLVVVAFHYLANELIDVWGADLRYLGGFRYLKFLVIVIVLFSSIAVVMDTGARRLEPVISDQESN